MESQIAKPYLLQMIGICKAFEGIPVLRDVGFGLTQGEVVGLLGENGAGKSTLMKILSGIHKPDDGKILIDGIELSLQSVKQSMAKGVVLIHQELNLLDNLDVASNIFLGREPLTSGILVDNAKLYSQAAGVLNKLKLQISPHALVAELSTAEQQMIEIAKALSQNARILIMDEPTSSLSISETRVLFHFIRELKRDGVSVIYISHKLNEINEIVDRVVVLKDGKNSGELQKSEINHDNMVRLMVGRGLEYAPTPKSPTLDKDDFVATNVVTRRYPGKKVSFKISRGEILGFAGLIGAGRTALVNSIFGITPFVDGTITLNDMNIDVRSVKDAIGNRIFLIPEDRRNQGVITEMSVIDNITLPDLMRYATYGYVDSDATKAAAQEQSVKLNIRAASADTLVKFLSGGNQQKIAIAKWLTQLPNLIIFDEPTKGVDVGAKAEIYRIMRHIADADAMVIVVSSDMEEIIKICDRILVMHEGEIMGQLTRDQFDEETIMHLAVGNRN